MFASDAAAVAELDALAADADAFAAALPSLSQADGAALAELLEALGRPVRLRQRRQGRREGVGVGR